MTDSLVEYHRRALETEDLDDIAADCMNDARRWFPDLHATDEAGLVHCGLGVAGEAGEIANQIKKANRDESLANLSPSRINAIAEECADTIIYSLLILSHLGRSPRAVIADKRAANEKRFGAHKDGSRYHASE